MRVSIGTRTLPVLPQVMCARRAVPKTPPKSSVPPRLPFHKSRLLRTRSESTLLQLLIPLHFNSRRCNTYKKPGEGAPPSSHKVLQLVTKETPPRIPTSLHRYIVTSLPRPSSRSCVHAGTPATPIPSVLYFITRGYQGGGGLSESPSARMRHQTPIP